MKKLIILFSASLILVSCAAGVQSTGVDPSDDDDESEEIVEDSYTPVDATDSNTTKSTALSNTTSGIVTARILSSLDLGSLVTGLIQKVKEAAEENKNCGQCTSCNNGKCNVNQNKESVAPKGDAGAPSGIAPQQPGDNNGDNNGDNSGDATNVTTPPKVPQEAIDIVEGRG